MADYDLQYQDTYIDVLLATANELKTAGYIYKGVATPSTNPGTPTERVAYLASEPGTYTNFGGIVITSGLYSLTYASGTWTATQMQTGSDIEVVQTTGDSTTDVMSQKAVTNGLSQLKWVDMLPSSKIGYAYYCSGNTGETAVGETESSAFRYVIINVAEGDMVKIYGRGGDAPRLWAILDADYKIINKADAQMISFDGIVTMPSNAAFFVFNNNNNYYATPKCEYLSADNIEEETTIKKRVELGTSSLYIPTWNSRNSQYEWNNANASHYIVPVVAGDMYEIIANNVHNADIQWVTKYETPVLNKTSHASTIDSGIHTILRDTKEIHVAPADARFMVVWAAISGVDFTPIINKIVDVKDETEKNNDAISVINGIEAFDLTPLSYKDKAFYCGDGVGEIASGLNTLANWECFVLPVNSGDMFIISGYGGGTPRLWAMLDKDMRIVSTADANTDAYNLHIKIPTGVKYFALNNYRVNNTSPRWDYYNTHATIEENANLGVSAPYTIVGKWTNVNSEHYIVRVNSGDKVTVTANTSYNAGVHWLTDYKTAKNNQSPYLSAYDASLHTIYAGTTQELIVPIDAQFMYVAGVISGGDHTPSAVLIQRNITEDDDVYFNKSDFTPVVQDHPLIYEADDKVNTNTHITSAVAYPNGEIIATRQGGSVVKIALDGTETTLLTINGANDWRGLWMDKNLNVYVTPFDGLKSVNQAPNLNNGIYRLPYGSNTMTKVLSLPVGYCMWTFAEDNDGYIYAGTYQLVTNNPLLYRSSDGGETWVMIYDFVNICPTGRHVHCILYNRFNNAMYAIIGEFNEMYKSADHGVTWEALNVKFVDKGTSVLDTQHGILVGSDNAYCCDIDMLLPDDKSHKRVARGWSNTPFAIRQSDLTGYIYAFCKIDAAAASASYFPQMADVNDTDALNAWIATNPSVYSGWKQYNNQTKDIYPEDCVRPQHFMIMMSRDDGLTWEIIYKEKATNNYSDGFWTAGYFRNGECLVGRVIASSSNTRDFVKPLVISEGKHKYTSGGIDCEGDIFIVTNTNNFVEAL